jgi:hypothetical protein
MLLSQLIRLAIITARPMAFHATDSSTTIKLLKMEIEYGALAGV